MGGVFVIVGFRLARCCFGPMLLGLARPKKRPDVPCLGRQSSTVDWGGMARCHDGPYRVVPGTGLDRAVPGGPNAHLWRERERLEWVWKFVGDALTPLQF